MLGSVEVGLGAQPTTPSSDSGDSSAVFDRLDRNGDGRIEASEVKPEHARLFRRLLSSADANHDGALDRAEFIAGLKERRPERPLEQLPGPPTPKELADAAFRKLDTNRDGKLELKEVPERRREVFKSVRRAAGAKSDGSLTRQEFEAVYEQFLADSPTGPKPLPVKPAAMPPAPPPQGEKPPGEKPSVENLLRRFMLLDANGDGKISAAEARGPLKNHFSQFDANGDGVLDGAELERAAQVIQRIRQQAGNEKK
ncbi:MAG: EF-hand domain-containing protein [Planctomycetia bacterium]|nr:EF-hand domain-containing protein [Planctomycetia bacterium]